jgi:hypothetical protein
MATRANIVIDQGTNFETQINIDDSQGNPIDLTTYTVESQIRKTYTSANAYSFTATANSSGVLVLALTANSSAAIPAGRYLYDVLVTSGIGNASRILEGQVTINPSVTR